MWTQISVLEYELVQNLKLNQDQKIENIHLLRCEIFEFKLNFGRDAGSEPSMAKLFLPFLIQFLISNSASFLKKRQ